MYAKLKNIPSFQAVVIIISYSYSCLLVKITNTNMDSNERTLWKWQNMYSGVSVLVPVVINQYHKLIY